MRKLSRILFIISLTLLLFACGKKTEKITTEKTTTKKQDVYYDAVFVDYDNTVLYQTRVKDGEVPSYSMSNPTRSNDSDYSYTFSGWAPTLGEIHSNTTYVAQYNRIDLPYTISFNLDGGTSIDTIKTIKTDKLDKSLFSFNVKKSGYAFKGWSYNNQIIFDEKGDLINTPVMNSNMMFKAEFREAVTLTINYSLYNPKTNELIETYETKQDNFGSISETREYNWNTYVNLFANLNEGYSFIGWYSDGLYLSNETNYNYMMWEEDFTIEARLKYTLYELNVYSNNYSYGQVMIREGNNQNYYNEQSKNEFYTEKVTVAAYSRTDVRFLGWYSPNNELVSTNAIFTFNMSNKDSMLEAKWNEFQITYRLNGGTNNENNPKIYDIDMNNIPLLDPFRMYYVFDGWYYDDELITEIDTKKHCNMNIEARWRGNSYGLTLTKSIDNAGEVIGEDTYEYNSSVTITVNTDDSYYFTGWYNGNSKVSSDSTYTFTMPHNDLVLKATFESNFIREKGNSSKVIGLRNKNITNLIIPNDVKSIGEGAFSGCSNLITLSIPFVGDRMHAETDTYQYPLGYIFGTSSYTGGIAADQYYYGSSTSSTTKTTYYIPATLRKVIVTGISYIQNGSFQNCGILESIIIPNSITIIGNSAFSGCSKLKSFVIPNSVINIGNSAFTNCSIREIYYDGTIEEWCNITFNGSEANPIKTDTSLYLLDNNGTIEYDGNKYRLFDDTNLVLSNKATKIGSCAFCNFRQLTSVIIPNSVTSIEDSAFYGCRNITNITIGNNVVSIKTGAFYGCNNLESIIIPNSVITIGNYAFYNCVNLESITIPNSVSSIGESAFRFCKNATIIKIGNNVTNIGNSAFSDCSVLESIIISNSVTSIAGYAFSSCGKLANIYYNGAIEDWCTISFGNYTSNPTYYSGSLYLLDNNGTIEYDDNKYRLFDDTDLVLSDKATKIGSFVFYKFMQLTSVIIPNSVTVIEEEAFYCCRNLASITIGNSVTSIKKYAFYGCNKLESIIIPNSVTNIGEEAFSYCNKLESITIPNSVTSIGSGAFNNCTCEILWNDNPSITSIGEAAFRNYKGATVTIPNSVTSIGYNAFSSCSNLTKIEIPNSVTTIGGSAFAGCTALVSISIPFVGDKAHTSSDRYQYPLGHIFGTSDYTGTTSTSQTYYGSSTSSTTSTTFYIPTTLKQVIITGSGYIQYGAFYNCSNITSVAIPVSITNISNYAFYNCTSLSKVYYEGTSAQWDSITIGSTQNSYLTGATRYYYSATNEAGNYWHYDDKHNVVEW